MCKTKGNCVVGLGFGGSLVGGVRSIWVYGYGFGDGGVLGF